MFIINSEIAIPDSEANASDWQPTLKNIFFLMVVNNFIVHMINYYIILYIKIGNIIIFFANWVVFA